jgi:hypothetical protein
LKDWDPGGFFYTEFGAGSLLPNKNNKGYFLKVNTKGSRIRWLQCYSFFFFLMLFFRQGLANKDETHKSQWMTMLAPNGSLTSMADLNTRDEEVMKVGVKSHLTTVK